MSLDDLVRQDSTNFEQSIAAQIWEQKYRYVSAGEIIDRTPGDTFRRVAEGVAAAEPEGLRHVYARQFQSAISSFRLLPAGRILAGAGTKRNVTLFNTFVMRTIPDSLAGIMDTMRDAAMTMQMGGGIGFDFSTIRPKGTAVRGLDCPAAGPLAAMEIADAVCKMVVSGMGRGAMMATLACDHPDIEDFVTAKSRGARLNRFNLSVLVTDRLMEAVTRDEEWPLLWKGSVVRTISARGLWRKIMEQTYAAAEPGVLFIDRINRESPLAYQETVSATNSCAEQPLPPNGACPLASINLARLVRAPFTDRAELDLDQVEALVETAVRMLDNVIDVSRYPLPEQRWEAMNKRRIGVGLTGLADALIMLGVRYGSPRSLTLVDRWLSKIQNTAYAASARLAAERGAFPMFNATEHLAQPALKNLNADVRSQISVFGLRNGVLTTLPPTGTISLFGGNVSSGIEPVFSAAFNRKIIGPDGTERTERVEDYAAWVYHRIHGADAPLPEAFVTVADLTPEDHVAMQATAQKWIDTGISKTVNCPKDIPFEAFERVYLDAYQKGCKGCTTYRPNDILGSVLTI